MLLYAGTTSKLSFKYFILNSNFSIILKNLKDIVKKLKLRSISAGNTFLIKIGTSETIRNNTEENIKEISVHVPKHLKPLNDEQFGHYLAGLIDGKGYFSSKQQLVIEFSYIDISLAYYIKKILGYGQVKKIKDKNVYLFILSNKNGIIKVINLINGKLRTISKFNQVINNITTNINYLKENLEFKINSTNDFNNFWIAGFSDVNANFQIKFLDIKNISNLEIVLNYQIEQKNNNILILIKKIFGGHIIYENLNDSYIYNTNSFGSARKIIKYFDTFHLQSSKYVNYLKWRKSYILIQNKSYLTDLGLNKILKKKFSMDRGSV